MSLSANLFDREGCEIFDFQTAVSCHESFLFLLEEGQEIQDNSL